MIYAKEPAAAPGCLQALWMPTLGSIRNPRLGRALRARLAAQLLESDEVALPVRPVKGQMILFKAPAGLVQRVVLMDGRYVIPRGDGRVLAGSTLEEAGFDKALSAEARESLWQSATRIMPALADCEVEHHWAGLRPGSPEGIPFIGAVPGVENLWVNAGHYRNGLVLAPASTRLLADELLGRPSIIDPAPYRLEGRLEGRLGDD